MTWLLILRDPGDPDPPPERVWGRVELAGLLGVVFVVLLAVGAGVAALLQGWC